MYFTYSCVNIICRHRITVMHDAANLHCTMLYYTGPNTQLKHSLRFIIANYCFPDVLTFQLLINIYIPIYIYILHIYTYICMQLHIEWLESEVVMSIFGKIKYFSPSVGCDVYFKSNKCLCHISTLRQAAKISNWSNSSDEHNEHIW